VSIQSAARVALAPAPSRASAGTCALLILPASVCATSIRSLIDVTAGLLRSKRECIINENLANPAVDAGDTQSPLDSNANESLLTPVLRPRVLNNPVVPPILLIHADNGNGVIDFGRAVVLGGEHASLVESPAVVSS